MKKLFTLIILIFISGCGYTSIYQETNQDLNLKILDMQGDFEINTFLKNDFKIASNKNSENIFELNIETEYNKVAIAKDSTGKATDYNIEMKAKFILVSNENKKINYEEKLKIKYNDDKFEQSNYERDIKRNFSKIIQKKLILDLIKLSDN